MVEYKIEGEIQITELQLAFILKVIVELGYEDSKVTIRPASRAGDNYVASVSRIVIEGDHGTFTMIAKIAPTDETSRAALHTGIMFHNEHVMYTQVLPKIMELQKQANVPEDDWFKYPKCYGSFTEALNEVILLEDLKNSDYVMLNRMESLSNECVISVMKNFAALHSLSYVLKEQNPATFNDYRDNLLDLWGSMANSETHSCYFQKIEDNILEVLDEPKHIKIIKRKIADVAVLSAELTKYEYYNKYSVIQHGDPWTNNIMFKFEGGTLKQTIMIDYQISKNSNPANDILYMIFNCTDHATRSKHFYDWIDYYYSELDKALNYFDLKAKTIYPRYELDADIKRYSDLALGYSMILASMLTVNAEDAIKMKDSVKNLSGTDQAEFLHASDLQEESRVALKNRLTELVDSFTFLGLLD